MVFNLVKIFKHYFHFTIGFENNLEKIQNLKVINVQ